MPRFSRGRPRADVTGSTHGRRRASLARKPPGHPGDDRAGSAARDRVFVERVPGPFAPPRRAAVALALALAALGACRFGDADRRAITTLLLGQADAWNRGDLDTFLRAYEPTEDLVFTSGATIRRGFAATRDRYHERYAARDTSTMGRLAFELLEIRAVGRDGAVVLGRWRLSDTPLSGEGVFTLVLQRGRDGWRIVHDHTSAAAPAENQGGGDNDSEL